jgi:hypothetical protein
MRGGGVEGRGSLSAARRDGILATVRDAIGLAARVMPLRDRSEGPPALLDFS